MTNDVAIIGVGLHPFGRFEGKSAMEMGVDAIFASVADAGVEWKDVQFATGGSWTELAHAQAGERKSPDTPRFWSTEAAGSSITTK
jgi:acetyl-CoA acetyltransferase